jgi:hypothetical protein
MNFIYMFGSAYFIVLSGLKISNSENSVWLGLYAICAVLGFLGQMNRKNIFLPLIGLLVAAILFAQGEVEVSVQSELAMYVSAIVWCIFLFIYWIKSNKRNSLEISD